MRLPLLLATLALPAVARATVPAGFTEETFEEIPSSPQITAMAWAPDSSNRLFVTGKDGEIWIVENGGLRDELFFRFVPRAQSPGGELVTTSECGLLGIAFHPDFIRNHFLYVFVTLRVPPDDHIEQQILRLTDQGNVGGDRQIVVRGLASTGQNHDGGGLGFGPDGLLYWAVGDNGAMTGVGNDTVSSAAKVGRAAAVPDAPPPPGPFNDGAGPNYDYIFARGFRNPYTLTFHPVTGKLWVNVVGTSWESIFVVEEGSNAGYPMENVDPGQGAATMAPLLAYPTGSFDANLRGTNGAVRSGGVVTFTTTVDHKLRRGEEVTVSGVSNASFNGTFTVASVPTRTTFTVTQAGGNASSGGGQAEMADYGYVVLGGTFYDATLFPEEYRRDFFFGDYGSGDLVRLETEADGTTLARAERWGDGFDLHIDAATGPDGALYLAGYGGLISRITFARADLGVVVSPQNLRMNEGGRGIVGVRLSRPPGNAVSVLVEKSGGDADVSVISFPTTLTFDNANWDRPQYAEVEAAIDGDSTEDVAMVSVSGAGVGGETVTVRVTDLAAPQPIPDAGVPDAAADAATAGPDAARPPDAGPTPDARPLTDGGMVGDADSGCSCRAGDRGSLAGVILLALALIWLRRR